jgi:AraC-like DNA-binding protein
MKKSIFFLLILILCFKCSFANDSLKVFSNAALAEKMEKAATAENPALKIYADELILRNCSDSIRCKVFKLLGDTYYSELDYDINKAIGMLETALEYAKKSGDISNEIKILDRLSVWYVVQNENKKGLSAFVEMKQLAARNIKSRKEYLLFQPREYSIFFYTGDIEASVIGYRKSADDITEYLLSHPECAKDEKEELESLRIYIQSELINYYNYQKKLDSSSLLINKLTALEKQGFSIPFGIWYQKAFFYILSGKYDEALSVMDEAQQQYISGSKIDTYQSLYYRAVCWQKKGDPVKSMKYCDEAIRNMIIMPSFLNYELEIYKLYADNAEKTGNSELSAFYSRKYISLSGKIDYAGKAQFVANLYDIGFVKPLNYKLEKESNLKSSLGYIIIFLVIISFLLLFKIFRHRNERKIYQQIVNDLQNTESKSLEKYFSGEELADVDEVVAKEMAPGKKSRIPKDNEQNIITQLDTFEEQLDFLDPQLSLGMLSSKFRTNSTYLSHVIKENKNNNFKGYINELRINYVIHQLKYHPEYTEYKISYLAEKAGFSSHTVFTRIFTEQKGISPSRFIEFLRKEEKITPHPSTNSMDILKK